jgi:polysaccharide biosynthesis/export protein
MLISSGDMLDIGFYGVPELSQKVRVSNGGDAYLALIGYVHLNGTTIEDSQALIEKRYVDGGFLKNPHVTILVTEYASGISLLGEVQRPGIYPVLGQRRLFDIISAAGGLRDTAGRTAVITHRDAPSTPIVVHISDDPMESAQSNLEVHQGDTINIPKAPVVYVVGEVSRPSGFAVDNGQTLTVMRAVALAGGTTRIAALDRAKIIRKDDKGAPHEIPVELKKIMQAKADDVLLQPDDIFFIPTSAAKNAATRTMESILQVVTGVGVRHF